MLASPMEVSVQKMAGRVWTLGCIVHGLTPRPLQLLHDGTMAA